jgi:hypothetical protein
MAIPVSERLRALVSGDEYEAARAAARERFRFRLLAEVTPTAVER